MSKIPFQASVSLLSAVSTTGLEWEIKISFSDRTGVNTPVDILVGDVVTLDTSALLSGTVAILTIEEILVNSFTAPTLRVTVADTFGGTPPDLGWVIGSVGIISRPTENASLLPVISPDSQLVSDSVSFALLNLNLAKIDLELLKSNNVNGAVFITNVESLNADEIISDKVFSPDGFSLIEGGSVSTGVRVHVVGITGHTNYNPNITVNGLPVSLVETQNQYFTGSVDITLDDTGIIRAIHEDGAVKECQINKVFKPEVLSSSFSSDYPINQTELKAGDTMSIWLSADVPVVEYEVDSLGAFEGTTGTLDSVTEININGLLIADRGTVPTPFGYRVRVKTANGIWSDWYNTSNIGFINGIHTVVLNNLGPTININAITYPTGSEAVKGIESVTVNNSIINADSVRYASSEFEIVNGLTQETNKVFTRLVNGTPFQVEGTNFTISATRTANGFVTSVSGLIKIVDISASVLVSTDTDRLRSGGSNGTSIQAHPIRITSSQPLIKPPSLNAPEGTWSASEWASTDGGYNWVRNLLISDSNVKGLFGFNSLIAVGLSNLATNTITGDDTYTLGGFVFRTLTVPAFPNRITDIGTLVTDVTKLRVTNLSKGASGSLNFSYTPTLDELVDRFTIVDSSLTLNPTGGFWYNNDGLNASSNTTGELTIEIEEVI